MAQIAASLGQSGKSYEQIFLDNQQTGEKSYLYDTARLAAAWDIDAKSAADYMAKWETAFGKTHNQIIDIADSINYLGGHMATTAAEIASVVNTSGGVGQTAGVDLHTTSALAATMLAMGVNEGKAGTSLNLALIHISNILDCICRLGLVFLCHGGCLFNHDSGRSCQRRHDSKPSLSDYAQSVCYRAAQRLCSRQCARQITGQPLRLLYCSYKGWVHLAHDADAEV